MSDESSFVKDPTVVFLTSLLADVKRGAVRLPRFQRSQVWKDHQRLDLLDSVAQDIPIGAVMLWRTGVYVASRDRIGPHRFPPEPKSGAHLYILDGGQRVATLLGALYVSESEPESEDVDSDEWPRAYYDLAEQCFVEKEAAEEVPAHWLPLSDVLQTVALLKFQRGLKGPNAELWMTRADAIASQFRSYKVPVVMLGSEDVEKATTTFKRVNSTGTKMSELDMVCALTWSAEFDLDERLSELRADKLTPLGWGDLDDEVLLRCIKVTLGLDLYASVDEVRRGISMDPGSLDRAAAAIEGTVGFLEVSCGIQSPWHVPYAHQIPLLALAFSREPTMSPTLLKKLKAWVWLTTYASLFSGMSGYGLTRVQDCILMLTNTGKLVWPGRRSFKREPLPKRYDFRLARSKALAFRLASKHKNGFAELARLGAESMVQLFPKGSSRGSPGNRFFAPSTSRMQLKAELFNDANARALHSVSDDAFAALIVDDSESFIRFRQETLNREEEAEVTMLAAFLDEPAPDEED